MEELRKLRAQQKEKKKKKKEEAIVTTKGGDLPPIGGSSLPALNMGGRRGNFDMIPDFLKNNK